MFPAADEVVRSLLSGYKSQRNEYDYWVPEELIDGEIPAELEGTLFRNGPGLVDVGGTRLDQPFDGDGMINQFCFRDGRLHYRNRHALLVCCDFNCAAASRPASRPASSKDSTVE